jgi:hypothetical protein
MRYTKSYSLKPISLILMPEGNNCCFRATSRVANQKRLFESLESLTISHPKAPPNINLALLLLTVFLLLGLITSNFFS